MEMALEPAPLEQQNPAQQVEWKARPDPASETSSALALFRSDTHAAMAVPSEVPPAAHAAPLTGFDLHVFRPETVAPETVARNPTPVVVLRSPAANCPAPAAGP